ncbi:hypothetical protein FOIG_06572 [Fusarium odoratissimum NRRL 54006]|uniref:Uncharacterized protein n=1 Tax=Fusarium odoratissimum (strain NRRL 54006) TaxID=1089451 RepID=X0K0W7_FUSO5|nr:uncharacterized protein FOIG_06572 [Fusarium odoratissimum NRRL 54006]EXM02312.1 hypothetical protein FOIG_06572 [Fusarium odoratissimum NRRL 54006]
MAYSFAESFFIGWATGVCTTSLAVTIIVLALRGTARGVSVFAWLSKNHNPDVAETSAKQTIEATNVPIPQQVPESQIIRSQMNPNPITESHRELAFRVIEVCGPDGIRENVAGFECLIENLFMDLVYGGVDPAITPGIMPTVERSSFNDQELVRLAGDPPEGETWSELICDRDTRFYAIWTFLNRFLYRRMDPNCNVEECLLPLEVSSCFQLIPHRHFAHSKLAIYSIAAVGSTDIIPGEDSISVWREILFMMLMTLYKMVHIPATDLDKDDPRRERIDSMVSEVADALNLELLEARGRSGADIKKTLSHIFGCAANCALIFFGQPSVWEADWDSDPGRLVAPRIRFMWNGQIKWTRPPVVYNGTLWAPLVPLEPVSRPRKLPGNSYGRMWSGGQSTSDI